MSPKKRNTQTRKHSVHVVQPLEKIHVVEAKNMKETKSIIETLIRKNEQLPQFLESFPRSIGKEKTINASRYED